MSEMTAIGSEISLKDEDDRVFGAQLPAASRGTARGGWTFLACGGLGGTAYAALPIKSVVNAVERAVPAPQIETIIKRRRWFWLSPWLVAWPPLLVPQSEVRRLANQSANQPTTSAREITSGIRRRQVIPILSRIFRRDPLARDLPRLHSGLGEPAAGASPREEAGGQPAHFFHQGRLPN